MSNLKVALDYLNKNKLMPMPCMGEGNSKGKTPLIKWKEIQELPTEQQVTEWFNKFPEANIGFKTGKISGILVLDNDGVEIKQPLPLTPTATSREGHFHSYFKNPDFYVPQSVSEVGDNLDIRCDQAFIVAPPSKHFDKNTGELDGQYSWIDGMSPDDIPFAPCPDWLIANIKETLSNTTGFDWSTALNVGIGARDDTLTRTASSLIAKGFEYETALSILRGINSTYTPPLEDDLVVNKLETAIEFIRSKRITQEEAGKVLTTDNRPVLLSELKAEDYKKSWIWEGYIAKGGITLLTADPKAGKSEFIRGLLRAIENEVEFIGQPTTKTNVLVISEEPVADWVEKREEFGFENKLKFWIWPQPFLVKIKLKLWESFFQEVLDFCKENEVEFIIFDTISKNWPVANENDATQVTDALRPTYLWQKNNLAVLLVHHDNKTGGAFGKNIRGSSAIAGFGDMNMSYGRLEGAHMSDRKRVLNISGRYSNAEGNVVIEWQDDLSYKYIGDRFSVSKSGRIEVILGIFQKDTTKTHDTTSIKSNWDLTRFGTPPSLRTIQRYVTELYYQNKLTIIEEKVVVRKKTPFYALTGKYNEQMTINNLGDLAVSSVNKTETENRRHDSGQSPTGSVVVSEKDGWTDPDPNW